MQWVKATIAKKRGEPWGNLPELNKNINVKINGEPATGVLVKLQDSYEFDYGGVSAWNLTNMNSFEWLEELPPPTLKEAEAEEREERKFSLDEMKNSYNAGGNRTKWLLKEHGKIWLEEPKESPTFDEFIQSLPSTPGASPEAIELLEEYDQWEADIIGNDSMWWPNSAKDSMPEEIYEKMIELLNMEMIPVLMKGI